MGTEKHVGGMWVRGGERKGRRTQRIGILVCVCTREGASSLHHACLRMCVRARACVRACERARAIVRLCFRVRACACQGAMVGASANARD